MFQIRMAPDSLYANALSLANPDSFKFHIRKGQSKLQIDGGPTKCEPSPVSFGLHVGCKPCHMMPVALALV